ncbi:MAG: hypothetical protein QNK03_23465 [Myxococcota bacterium]|nr:hypothetical protein [Myxococcota bacterium]
MRRFIGSLGVLIVLGAACGIGLPGRATECLDSVDNDGNGNWDWSTEPGCRSMRDDYERDFAAGHLFAVAIQEDALFHLDPTDGRVAVLHRGAPLSNPTSVAADYSGGVLVGQRSAIYRFDLEHGFLETVIEDEAVYAHEMALGPDGSIYTFADGSDAILRVHPRSGHFEVVTFTPFGLDLDFTPDGDLVILDGDLGVFEYDLHRRTLHAIWAEPGLRDVAVDPAGNVHVTRDDTVIPLSQRFPDHFQMPRARPQDVVAHGVDEIYAADRTGTVYELSSYTPEARIADERLYRLRDLAPARIYQCNDGVDNDGDGRVDMEDSDCRSGLDNSEYHIAPGDLIVAAADSPDLLRIDARGEVTSLASTIPVHRPWGLLLDPESASLYYTEEHLASVVRLDLNDGHVEPVTFGTHLSRPRSLAMDFERTLLVTDGDHPHVVAVTDGLQTNYSDWTDLRFASGLAMGPVIGRQASYYVAEWGGTLIQYWYRGEVLATADLDHDPVPTVPMQLATTPDGKVLMAGGRQTDLVRFGANLGAPETRATGFDTPVGLAVGRDGGVFVTDRGGVHRVVFDPPGGGAPATELVAHLERGLRGIVIAPEAAPARGASRIVDGDFGRNAVGSWENLTEAGSDSILYLWPWPGGVRDGSFEHALAAHFRETDETAVIEQCVNVAAGEAGEQYLARGLVLLEDAWAWDTQAEIRVRWHDAPCVDGDIGLWAPYNVGTIAEHVASLRSKGIWSPLESAGTVPAGARSAVVRFDLHNAEPAGPRQDMTAWLDDAAFYVPEPNGRSPAASALLALLMLRRRGRR